jgi:uncharacterized membrane protein
MRNFILKLLLVCCSLSSLHAASFAQDSPQHSENAHALIASKSWDNDAYWKWGVFYFNKGDSRLFPPKRDGMGWTINFANPLSVGTMVLILVAMVAGYKYYKKSMASSKNAGNKG